MSTHTERFSEISIPIESTENIIHFDANNRDTEDIVDDSTEGSTSENAEIDVETDKEDTNDEADNSNSENLIVYEPSGPVIPLKWKTPPWNMLKCNIGASWRNDLRTGGASWNILDSQGRVLSHSRRAYTGISSLWKQSSGPSYVLGVAHGLIVSLNSSRQGAYHMTCVHFSENKIANEISRSVTRYLRIQSYVAHGGPSWLLSSIASEAVSNAVM
ncbi:hypothetical protein Bca4012_049496 [Brassica carinata]